MTALTVSQLARAAGVGTEAVRHYEDIGLLLKAVRGDNGYRHFPAEALQRMGFIKRAKSLGFGLPEITELLRLSDQRQSGDASDMVELRQAASAKLADVDARIEELKRIRQELVGLVNSCPGKGAVRDCPILAALSEAQGETPSGRSKTQP